MTPNFMRSKEALYTLPTISKHLMYYEITTAIITSLIDLFFIYHIMRKKLNVDLLV